MNLESNQPKKNFPLNDELLDDDFNFKPITAGLGFHQPNKSSEMKTIFQERAAVPAPTIQTRTSVRNTNVYENDLSIFYNNQSSTLEAPAIKTKAEAPVYKKAIRAERFAAYVFDLAFILSSLGLILTIMARTIGMDLLEVWASYPNEITPLVLTLFCGFFILYFSIFEKTSQSTLGKSFFSLRVLSGDDQCMPLSALMIRSLISLLNFVSLGLFSYFDLQDKISHSRVVKTK